MWQAQVEYKTRRMYIRELLSQYALEKYFLHVENTTAEIR